MTAPTVASRQPHVDVTPAEALPARLGLLPWDVGMSGAGHDPRSTYVETFWLPLLGPSTVLVMRRLARELDQAPAGTEIAAVELSRDIGLGDRLTRRAPIVRTLDRCAKFNLVLLEGAVLYVRKRLPSLSPRQVARLSAGLGEQHATWERQVAEHDRRGEQLRAAHVAGALLRLGEPANEVQDQLTRWGFVPGTAWNAVHWAQSGELDHA